MTTRRPSTSVRFLRAYLTVLAAMVGWWLILQASTDVGVPALTLLVAYAGPVAAWAAVVAFVGGRRRRS